MRVLQVLSSLNRISGVANVVMNYYRMLHNEVKFDFLLYAPVDDSFADEAKSYGSDLFYIPKFGIASYTKYKKKISEFFEAHKGEYDIVHIHELMSQRIIVPIARSYGIKVVMHSHGPYPDRKMVGTVKAIRNKILLKNFDKNADHYLACSDVAATAFKSQKQVQVLRNGVDISRYISGTDMRDELNIPRNKFVVGSVGRITEQKNPLKIIDIFAAVHNINSQSVLVMAGEGEMTDAVKARIEEHQLGDSVMLIGNCNRVPELMRSFDAFLLPSLWEGLPVVLVEAQAAGLPCFCSDTVSKEGDLAGNVKYIPLDEADAEWAQKILGGKKSTEQEVASGFSATGYDLSQNAQVLLNVYRGVVDHD